MDSHDAPMDDEIVEDEEGENGTTALKRLREKLKIAVEEKQKYLENWQRERADLANYKRDEGHRRSAGELQSKIRFTESLIPVLDSFDSALRDETFKDASPSWKQGIEALYQSLQSTLKKLEVEQFVPKVGEPFDPYLHEALREVPTGDKKNDHTIESVERPGYSIGDRIVRPAQVTVRAYT